MVQVAVTVSLMYFVIVYILSFILEKLHVITKPPLKKGFMSSSLFYIGIFFALLGIYLYGSSKVIGILFCLTGVITGVFKASSDILLTNTSQGNPNENKQEPATDTTDSTDSTDATGTANTADIETNNATSETPNTRFNEQVILNVVTGKATFFVSLYVLLAIFFSLCIIFSIFGFIISFMASTFGKAQADDIVVFFKLIASFDFSSNGLRNTAGAQTDALIAAYALAVSIALLILSTIFGLSIRVLKKRKIHQTAVSALLPGHKRGFVPSSEGIYKLCYHNLWTKNKFYLIYPWESLSLCVMDEKKNRIILKVGRVQMPLIPWSRESKLFNDLKSIVLAHLPMKGQILSTKKVRYRWSRVFIAILIIIVLQVFFAGWLEIASSKGGTNDYCDANGKIHYSFKPAFAISGYALRIFDGKNNTLHTYCELHGVLYEILHPKTHIDSIERLIHEKKSSQITDDPILIIDMLILPTFVWLGLLIIVLYAGKPLRFRFNVL